ncbi:MAG: DUF2207 domain-containing protein [Candidatus Dojkabacteria bacterium]
MKKILLSILFSFFLLGVTISGSFAQDSFSNEEQISLFKSTIELKQNTDINIVEEISYYFPAYKHGMVREIPTDYKVQAGFKRPTTIKVNDIYYYSKSSPEIKYDIYERSSKNGYTIFKIGDPDTTITGEYVFVIDYTIRNMINYFDAHDELYINVTGNGWEIPINQSYTQIKVPGKITEKVCYTGIGGSTASECTFQDISEQEVKVSVKNSLKQYEGLTVALKMPKGTLEDTTTKQRIAMVLANLGVLLPVPVFLLINIAIMKKGKNKKLTVIPHYDAPKDLYPLLAGYIFNKNLNNKHITAEIIKLAIDGYIKIKQDGKDKYILTKTNISKEIDTETVKSLYTGLFGKKDEVAMKDISSDFYKTVNDLRSTLNREIYAESYFDESKKKLKNLLLILGIIGGGLTLFVVAPLLAYVAATGWTVGLFLSFLVMVILATTIDLRAKLGNEMYYDLLGLKMYINTAEKHRIEFHDDPKKFKGVFEKLLPYAVIFGLEKKWAKEFEDIYQEQPSWYEGDINTFNTYMLVNSISKMNTNVQSKSVPPSNSSGGFASSGWASGGSGFSGGSSGGGGGGGGGGSW